MARRTQIFQLLPQTGGWNTSVEPQVLPAGDLQICDNVQILSSGIKTKREGFTYWDALSDIPTPLTKSSSGTTRTIVFSATVNAAGLKQLVVGEKITVTGHASYLATAAAVVTITTTNVTNDTITYTGTGSYTDAGSSASALTVTRSYPIVSITDFWRFTGSARVQQVVAITSQDGSDHVFYYDSSGRRLQPTMSGTARVTTSARVNTCMFNEYLLIFSEGTGNVPYKYDQTTVTDLAATAPDASIGTVWLSRVWTNDKTTPDRLHYSATGSLSNWQGASDSGAIDIRPGDGDPEGITAIFPFKGRLFVAKRNRLYQIVGDSPENFQVLEVSTGLGVEAHGAVAAVDQNDVIYVSNKGIHSIATTANYGDFSAEYVSLKIQPSFNNLELSRLKNTQAVYVPTLNSIAFSVAENATNSQDSLWLYNYILKVWYRWPEVTAQSIATILLSGKQVLFMGTSNGKIVRAQNGTKIDYGSRAIRYRIKSGSIYPDQSPITLKAFKRLTVFFKPKTSYSFLARAKIDNHSEQALGFSGTSLGDLLGVDFILGSSILGTDLPFAPRSYSIDGYGYGIIIDIDQSGIGDDVDIYGFAIEYEGADFNEESVSAEE